MPLRLRALILCAAAALLAPAAADAYPVADGGSGGPVSGPKKHGKKQGRKRQPRRQSARRPTRVRRSRRPAVQRQPSSGPPTPRRSTPRRAHRRKTARHSAPAITPGLSDFTTPEPGVHATPPRKPSHRRPRERRHRPPDRRAAGTHERAVSYLRSRDALGALPFSLGDPFVAVLERAAGRRVRREARRVERRREHRELVRSKAHTYMRAVRTVNSDRYGGALNLGLAHTLSLGSEPGVRRAVREIEERRREHRRRRALHDRATLYLRGLAALESDPHGHRTPAIMSALAAGGDPRVRRIAGRITERQRRRRLERRRERRQEVLDAVYGPDIGGPELIDRPTWGKPLPWNATFVSGTLGCERRLYPSGALSCMGLGGNEAPLSASLGFEVTRTNSRSEERLHTDGERYVGLGLSSDYRLTGSGRAELERRGGLALEEFLGREVSYTLNVSPERADSIADGNTDGPHPLDPRSLAQGESIELSSENYSGNGQSANYRLLQLQLGYSEGHRVSSGVRRLRGDRVRIYVGDERVVKNALEFGLGTDDLGIAAGLSDEFADGRLRTTDLDLGTRAGWNTYQRFIGSGYLPRSPSNPGVRDAAVVDSASWESSRTLELHAGPVTLGGTWNPYDGEVTETLHEDGTRERAVTSRDRDVTYIRSQVRRPGGRWRPGRLSLLLQGADADTVEQLLDSHGRSASLEGEQDLLLDYSPSDLRAVRQDALEQLSFFTQGSGEEMTPDEVDEYLRSQDDYAPTLPVPGGGNRHLLAIATSASPGEILDALTYGTFGNATHTALELATLQALYARNPASSYAPHGRVVLLD